MTNLENIKKSFYSNGFVHVEKLFSRDEIRQVLKEIEKVKKKFTKIKNKNMHLTKDKKFNTIHDINKFIKKGKIIDFSKDRRLVNIIEKIIGKKIALRNIEFFLKPKKTGMKAPVHQDNYFWNISNKKALNVWVACSASNFKNGGIYYFLKSHKDGIVKHELSYQPGTSQQIPKNYLKKKNYKKVYPNLKPGDCIFHHCEIIHGSNANHSSSNRIALVMSFKNKMAKVNKKRWKSYQKKLEKNLSFLRNTQ